MQVSLQKDVTINSLLISESININVVVFKDRYQINFSLTLILLRAIIYFLALYIYIINCYHYFSALMNRLLIKKEAASADVTTSYNIMGIFYVDIYFYRYLLTQIHQSFILMKKFQVSFPYLSWQNHNYSPSYIYVDPKYKSSI